MLVLTLLPHQRVIFRDDQGNDLGIVQTVGVPIGKKVRVGFAFPQNVKILRAELLADEGRDGQRRDKK